MTSGFDPIEAAIDDAARRITAHTPPDLRLYVAARLGQPARRLARWQPALAAAALVTIVLALWEPGAPPADPPRATGGDIALAPPPHEQAAVPPAREMPSRASAARAPVAHVDPTPWPELEQTIEPLELQALAVEPIDTPAEPPGTPAELPPLAIEPLALEPLAEPETERRR